MSRGTLGYLHFYVKFVFCVFPLASNGIVVWILEVAIFPSLRLCLTFYQNKDFLDLNVKSLLFRSLIKLYSMYKYTCYSYAHVVFSFCPLFSCGIYNTLSGYLGRTKSFVTEIRNQTQVSVLAVCGTVNLGKLARTMICLFMFLVSYMIQWEKTWTGDQARDLGYEFWLYKIRVIVDKSIICMWSKSFLLLLNCVDMRIQWSNNVFAYCKVLCSFSQWRVRILYILETYFYNKNF